MKNFYKKAFLATMLTMSAMVANAYDFEVNGIYYNIINLGKSLEVTHKDSITLNSITFEPELKNSRDDYKGNVSIPASVEYGGKKYAVTTIGECAFYDCHELTSVNIPNSVTGIGGWAFAVCPGLTSINIPNGVTYIGWWAFAGCPGLSSINIPNSVTVIGGCAFDSCSGLTSINIPNGVTEIGMCTFFGCSSLTSINIPNNVTYIGIEAFYYCTSLKTLTIGCGVETIDEYAFSNCTAMTSLTSEATTPPTCGEYALTDINKDLCTLYVPSESINLYQEADQWKDFYNIKDDVVSAINEISTEEKDKQEVSRYNINGQLIDSPQLGVNIIRYSDGTIEKVYVK